MEAYEDRAEGIMEEGADGGGRFSSVTLRPKVLVQDEAMIPIAEGLHAEANRLCFIANSVNFPVHHEAETKVKI